MSAGDSAGPKDDEDEDKKKEEDKEEDEDDDDDDDVPDLVENFEEASKDEGIVQGGAEFFFWFGT